MAASVADASPAKKSGVLTRIVSAVVLAPPVLLALWYGFPWIDLLAAVAAPLMAAEWIRMTRGRPIVRGLGVLYIVAAVLALLWIRHQPEYGRETVLWLVAVVWATDIGGYVVGRSAGGAKLAPRISPGKTWSGLIGGMSWAAVVSSVCGWAFGLGDTWTLALAGAALGVVDQLGDLLESHTKRRAGVKDSGRLIPGHGGILDRVDGLIAVLVVVAAVRLTVGGDWPW
jgi:phosphatidate cytidylyltransferase